MLLEKVGLNLGKEIIAWTRVSVLLHGHPTYHSDGVLTTPISVPDFRTFLRLPINEVVAYNEFGQYSLMRKTDKFRQLKNEEVESIIEELNKKLLIF